MACAVLGFVGLLNMALRVSFFIIGVQEAEWHPKIHRLFVFGSFSFSIGPSGEKVWVNHLYPESMIQTKNTVFTLVHSLKLISSPMLHTYTKFHGSQACSFSVILLWKKLNTANQNLMFIFNGLNRLNAYMKITHKQTSNITRERANLYYSAIIIHSFMDLMEDWKVHSNSSLPGRWGAGRCWLQRQIVLNTHLLQYQTKWCT